MHKCVNTCTVHKHTHTHTDNKDEKILCKKGAQQHCSDGKIGIVCVSICFSQYILFCTCTWNECENGSQKHHLMKILKTLHLSHSSKIKQLQQIRLNKRRKEGWAYSHSGVGGLLGVGGGSLGAFNASMGSLTEEWVELLGWVTNR